MDAASDCLAAAITGKCTSNGAYMAVNCKASCGLCGVALGSATGDAHWEEGALDSVPLMFSGQRLADDDPEFREDAVFVGGDIMVHLMQPMLADRCCWGANAMVRYETSGSLSVPEDGIVVFRFAGKEADVMPFARGEFHAVVRGPGRYKLEVAIESHDRSQRLALADAELVVSQEGPMLVSVEVAEPPDGEGGGMSRGADRQGARVNTLKHALRPHSNASCSVHCVSTDELDELRADAAHQLHRRDVRVRAASVSPREPSHEAETFVLQIGACDGELADPIMRYMHQYEWSGLLVEPLPDLFARLQHTYRHTKGSVVCACVCVCERERERERECECF